MYPFIGKIGPLTIYSYGVMLAVAVIVCTFLLSRDARRKGISPEVVFDLAFWVMVSGLIGARIFYFFLRFDYFRSYPLEVFMIAKGGLSWQGGLIGAVIFTAFFIKRRKLSFPMIADLTAPYVAFGQSIGRIGCFLNGCCYGKEVAWGIYFPVHNAYLYPTQLYSSFGLFIIFVILKVFQKHARFPGEVFIVYLILASVQRFFIEYVRADHEIFWMSLSIFQCVSLGVLVGALALYFHLLAKSKH